MERWQCEKCSGYFCFSVDKIFNGSKVSFKLFKDGLTSSNYNFIFAVVLNIDKDFFYLVSHGVFYKIKKEQAYPEDAPAKIVYNMFWTCIC